MLGAGTGGEIGNFVTTLSSLNSVVNSGWRVVIEFCSRIISLKGLRADPGLIVPGLSLTQPSIILAY